MHRIPFFNILTVVICAASLSTAANEARDARKADTRAVIPRLATAPTIDGNIEHAEWQDAMVYNGVLYQMTLNLFPRNVEWRLGWTEDGLYVASHTLRMEGETPRAEAKDGTIDSLKRDDSMELRIYPGDDHRTSLHLVINPEGTWMARRRIRGKNAEGDAGIKARASLTEKALDYELHIPFTALDKDASVKKWRILPVRNFRQGTNFSALLPHAHRGAIGGHDRVPVFSLSETLPFVQLQPLQQALYGGQPMMRAKLSNPADAAQEITASIAVSRGGETIGRNTRTISLPPRETLPVTLPVQCNPAIDPEAEDEYRYVLDITGPEGVELFHTHFTWNPTENRAWLGDKLPGYKKSEERVVTIDPREPVPMPFQRFMKPYENLPEDHRLQITTKRTIVPGKGYMVDSVQHITPVGPDGKKDGVQTFYRLGYMLEHSVTWKDGVRHGPEKFYAHEHRNSYTQKIIPWVDGEIRGVQRVFHPNGEPLAETEYKDGRPAGISKRYDNQGRLTRETPYQDGLPHGEATDYYPRRPRRVIPVRDGKIQGTIVDYNWDGRIVKKTKYEDGMELDIAPLEPSEEDNGKGSKLRREFDSGSNEAAWYDDEGRVVQSVEYRDGKPDGTCTLYYPRRIKRTVPYKKGLIDGVVVDYWENGNVKKKRPFKEDILHGKEQHFNEAGEQILERNWKDGEIVGNR